MSGTFVIRQASEADLAGIAALHLSGWELAYGDFLPVNQLAAMQPERRLPLWREWLADPQKLVLVGSSGQDIDGFVLGGPVKPHEIADGSSLEGFDCEIYSLHCRAGMQGKGLGRALIGAAASVWRARGRRALVLWAYSDNPYRRFYERIGGELVASGFDDGIADVAYGWRDLEGLEQPMEPARQGEFMTDRILILDFGSQVTQLIARRVREAGVYCEIYPFSVEPQRIRDFAPQGIILSGSPHSVTTADGPRAPAIVWDSMLPVLGICYGEQTMCAQLGGHVEGSDHREFGRSELHVLKEVPLFEGVWVKGGSYQVWMSHGDRVVAIPSGFEVVATSDIAPFAAIANVALKRYAVQFHPEVAHTPDGAKLLANFVHRICGCKGDWTMAAFRDQEIAKIRAQVGKGRVICGLSGGVDSAVAAVLIHQAIGDQLTCIFVDHGLLRAGEGDQVVTLFRDHYNIPLVHRDASDLFLGQLSGVSDPETKRKTIGRLFIEVFDEEAKKAGGADFLAQGTLYPDVIESVSFTGGPSVTIKSHHNVGGLPERMRMQLVEPLRELFKDEVRALGRELGLPEKMIRRHPFPGPGLAIRIPGDITREKLDILRKADIVYLDEIDKAGLYDRIWQAFAVLLPVRTVGVMGDGRTYDQVCALRAVTSSDGMTADFYPFEPAFLGRVATRIVNEVKGINRVVYDYTSKPPGTIEWE